MNLQTNSCLSYFHIFYTSNLQFLSFLYLYRASLRQSLTVSPLNHSYLRAFRVGWTADWAGLKQAATRHSRTQSDSMGDLARSISRSMNVLHTHTHTHTAHTRNHKTFGLYQYWPMIQLLTRSTVLRRIWIFPISMSIFPFHFHSQF